VSISRLTACFLLLATASAGFGQGNEADVIISIDENVIVNDDKKALPPVQIDVTETITIGDDKKALPPVQIDVAETITIGDDKKALPPVQIDVAETITIGDDKKALLPPQANILLADDFEFTPPEPAPFNDTGIVWGANYPSGGNADCSGETAAAQDCAHGRDVTHNDDTNGHAGFHFTKLDSDGNTLPASASVWSCVKDEVTGLSWELKTDDGSLQDADNLYTWYNPDSSSNGGDPGVQNGGTCSGAINCDTQGYINAINSLGLCGASGWRLPTLMELISIVNYNQQDPAIDSGYFPNDRSHVIWSSLPTASNPLAAARGVLFFNGSITSHLKSEAYRVRLVRDGP